MRQIIDGIPYELQKPFNLRFLKQFGRVFRVYDDQDSGNLCFGVEKNGVRTFVKLADYRRERERWPLNDALYRVAARAVSPDRSDRQQSIHQFIMEWNAAR